MQANEGPLPWPRTRDEIGGKLPWPGTRDDVRGATQKSVAPRSVCRLAGSEAAPAVLAGSQNGLQATDGPLAVLTARQLANMDPELKEMEQGRLTINEMIIEHFPKMRTKSKFIEESYQWHVYENKYNPAANDD